MSFTTFVCSRCHTVLAAGVAPADEKRICDRCGEMVSLTASVVSDSTQLPPPPNSENASTVDYPRTALAETVEYGGSTAAPSLPAGDVPGFELLEVLGRGGMGVVYKARQVKLNRLVALKMILAGEHAGPKQVQRFLAEARAVAKLQHPNIVQVHEIGEHKGLPYLAMELVSGGSLAQRWRGQRQAPAEVAGLVEILARAMHAAHQAGIIHRDLKPANIFLTSGAGDAAAAPQPKIGDFGLAKQDDDGLQTASGAVMGTPSYMAPEQALGQSRRVGPVTDVYALGAILYTGLTGHAPFRGETTVEVLRQVAEEEPQAPALLTPGLPTDLETICLKCLRKEPAERYGSAAALAEDLRRFRVGEPIQARPAGWAERLWKWIRRRPARAALVGMTLLLSLLIAAVIIIQQQAGEVQEQADQQKQIAQLTQEFDDGLDAIAWTPQHVKHLERLEAELNELAADKAMALRQRLDTRLDKVIRDSFSPAKKPRVLPEDVPPIKEMITLLRRRDARLADALERDLEQRRRDMQLVLQLPPFQEVEVVFPGRAFEHGDLLTLRPGKGKFDPLLLSQIPCTRHVEMEVVFQHPTWEVQGPIGLVLCHNGKDAGYRFLVQVVEAPDQDSKKQSFAEVRRQQGSVRLRIMRNKLRLHEVQAPIAKVWPADRPLRLRAVRAGEKLSFFCNETKLDFEDAMPLTSRQTGVFGVHMAAAVPMAIVRAWSQEVPASPSPLERGDAFYAAGQFPEARLEYKAQTQASTDPAIRQEAQFKEALCHLELKELPRATTIFESLAKDESTMERWRILSSCQLWGLLLQQGKEKEADLIFRSLNPRYRIGELALFLPDHLRDSILNHYRMYYPAGIGQLMERPNQIPGLERALEIEEFFDTPRDQRQFTRFHLFRAYAKNGMPEKAMATAARLVKEAPFPTTQNHGWWFPFWEEYPLLLRQQKQAERALVELDRRLAPKKKEYRVDCLPLLIDRACVHAALERWDAAEQDLEEFFRRVKRGDVPARFWSRACLARGLLRERRGDAAGALVAWRLGLSMDGPQVSWTLDRASPIALVQEIILAARCQQLSDMDVENLIQQGIQQMGGYMEGMGFKAAAKLLLPDLSSEVLGPALRDVWQTPEGERLAHQVAFRELPLPELYRGVMVNAFVSLGQCQLEPYKLSSEEMKLARQMSNEAYTAFARGKLGRRHILDGTQLGALWRNQSSFLGWDYHAKGFEPALRGPMAYFFGLRYLHVHKNAKEAAVYFQRAQQTAPPKSSLHALAGAELKRLKEKK